MIKEEALVIGLNGRMASIEIVRSKPCGLCGKTQGCGNSIWGKIFSHRRSPLELPNTIGAIEGDRVYLEMEESYLLKTSMLLYGAPLLFIFFGMGFTEYFMHLAGDFYVLIVGVVGFLLGLALIKVAASKNHNRLYNEARMIKITQN